ncbi:tRNA 5-methoxyuridine(34)/uridine 5-oxyacetic acid(34) synthase CmoB [Wenzhouxiangella marina]|uniref:tRNA U34 carboxymethyltransferase n=1 Tax=Wenzhouxiangella marina TaxID=1579979 RepID=A0A0K0XS07_9GAMM|nr:tRNA 5-methoxyuridine(34)/uridine 5-oxyacetic acid(34) synthase CmoB [Wenzhouxiangella marina]AKS40406.1 tRNA methyltransferase [Wenzhouxiangella marina]MBB6088272.1 tRNA (mo5U34)-methyltransferase [Wenzhouxiangella marina]
MNLGAVHRDWLIGTVGDSVAAEIEEAHRSRCIAHGDHERWNAVLNELPAVDTGWSIEGGVLVAGRAAPKPEQLAEALRALIPWRKGPLRLGGVDIETEWHSDWKWARIAPHVDLSGHRVLDVGAGNGYFGWAMLAAGAEAVVGCDPTQLFIHQHEAISHFAGPAPNLLLASTLEDLHPALNDFDTVCSFGVLYHRRDPMDHLDRLKARLRPGGQLVLETLIIPGEDDRQLDPPDRYANMRNVHALPTVPRLLDWLEQAGFDAPRCVDRTLTTVEEQRSTDWMPFHSLANALDPDDPSRTIEGHPAPLRAVILATRPLA